MKYLVVLHADSTAGKIYTHEKNDGFVDDGRVKHPLIVCTELSMDNHHYMFVRRILNPTNSHQSLHLPHSSVAMVVQFAEEQQLPAGFHLD